MKNIIDTINNWLDRDKVKITFAIGTFIFTFLGFAAERITAIETTAVFFYAAAYIAGGTYGLRAGLDSMRERKIDVDLLMILSAIGAAIVGQPFEGALLLFLFSLSNVLQSYAMGRTRNALESLIQLRPTQALTRRNGKMELLPLGEILVDDHILVRPGDRIPLDGTIVDGESDLDQSAITGESIPVYKTIGNKVLAGTINQNGSLEIRVTRLEKDSTLSKLIQLVENAQASKAKTQQFIERAEQYYALGVIVFTGMVIAFPLIFLSESFNIAFYRGMTVMVAASPCALVISTPATMLSAIGNGARRGILLKGGVNLEEAAKIKVVALDKTGTLTLNRPRVTDVVVTQPTTSSISENELLALAASVEEKSEHPLGKAIIREAARRGQTIYPTRDFKSTPGKGIQASVNGGSIHIGNENYYSDKVVRDFEPVFEIATTLQHEGKTVVLIGCQPHQSEAISALGVIAIADTIRPQAAQVVAKLKELGIEKVVMLTGDNQIVAQAIAEQAGITDVRAGLLPEDKLRIIEELKESIGPVAMVGDGVNDAPALATASVGIAMGAAGSDIALDTADIVLMGDDLMNLPYIISLSLQTRRTMTQNLVFSMGVIIVLVAGVLGFQLALPLSVIGHEGSTVLVSLNGLRLLRFDDKSLNSPNRNRTLNFRSRLAARMDQN